MEADPRRAELIVEELLDGTCQRDIATPGIDNSDEKHNSVEEMGAQDARLFRSVATRCFDLSLDRPVMQFSVTDICRQMSCPTVSS